MLLTISSPEYLKLLSMMAYNRVAVNGNMPAGPFKGSSIFNSTTQ
jgi:hypothetical protein